MQSSTGVVTAFDCETGKQLWARSVGLSDRAIYPATMNDETLFVINGLKMFAVQKTTGDILWELVLPRQPSASAVADNDRVYIGFLDGSMYAFDLKTILDLHAKQMLPQFAVDAVKWRFRTSQPIIVPALPEGALLSFASRNGSVYTVSSEDRKLKFQFETDAALSAPMIHYKDQLLLASEDAHFYSLNATNGRPAWEFATGDVIRKAPVLIDDEVYLLPDQGRLFKLSAATGKELWPRPRPRTRSFLSASARHLFVTGHDNTLQVLSRGSGGLEGEFPLERFTVHLTNDRNDRIYVATESGLIMCLHELGRDFPRFHLHPEREPVLPELAPDSFDPEAAAAEPPAAEPPAEEAQPEGDK
jgi:outer membrane protein assembly factor BamB